MLIDSTAILLNACSSSSSVTPPLNPSASPSPRVTVSPSLPSSPSLPPSLTLSPSPSLPPSPSLRVTASPSLPASPSPLVTVPTTPRLVVFAQDLSMPDDLALGPDQSIYFSDVGDGTVKRLDANGHVTTVMSNLQEPEGIVFLPDRSMLVAEQGKNRLVRYDPATGVITTFLQLENKTGQAGVDGIAFDYMTLTVIVPDSPNGTLLSASQDGKSIQQIASGLSRPTGAQVEPDGSLLVVEENGNTLRRIHTDGKSEILAHIPLPDDVLLAANGDIYVNALGDGAIHLINAANGQDHVFWRGLAGPQGIAWDADGNLVVAEPGKHRIIKLILG